MQLDIARKLWHYLPADVTMRCVNVIGQRDANVPTVALCRDEWPC
ncbi:MAG: hypothetical protein NZ483_02475 [Verrucomicrobiae bacterium]|nr:hypothetical protein [Verrucomicrobiae bacterium]